MAKASDNIFPLVRLAPGAAPATPAAGQQVLYLDSADGNKPKLKDSSGTVSALGGGGGAVPVVQTVYSGGNVTLAYSATRTAIAGLDVTIAAVTGDVIELDFAAILSARNSSSLIINCNFTAYTRVAAADVNNIAGGTATVSPWFGADAEGANGTPTSVTGSTIYTVQAGDLSGGNVTFRLYYLLDNGGAVTRTLFATATNPALLRAKNLKH